MGQPRAQKAEDGDGAAACVSWGRNAAFQDSVVTLPPARPVAPGSSLTQPPPVPLKGQGRWDWLHGSGWMYPRKGSRCMAGRAKGVH